jgi:hypothetical protein
MRKNREDDPLVAKYKEMVSHEAMKITMENLRFPELTSRKKIATFLTALYSGSDNNDSFERLVEITHLTPAQTRSALAVIREALHAGDWRGIDIGRRKISGEDFHKR